MFDDYEEKDSCVGAVLIRIHVPDLNIHKCLQFYRQDLVWDVKQQCLSCLPKELKESFNYGLFAPPCNGKVGKFLDEERPLADYPFSGPVGYLELRYKRRLYRGLSFDEKQLKSLHTKSNLKRFLEYVSSSNSEKVIKMCGKGLDPNFHCTETGETPLSIGAVMKKSSKLLIALVNGGALLDYRTRDGSTAMHRAVEHKNLESVQTLLDLGGSPNYRDGKGLTPLYLSVSLLADPSLCQALLHDHAFLGAQDQQGWHEIHQACRHGLIHHLEHLLYYGADMNARNASGNTPLHVCGVNNQDACARLLLYRGADKEALNYANQTPYQVSIIAGNMELAQIIQEFKSSDVVRFREMPKYNPKRRLLSRTLSELKMLRLNPSASSNNKNVREDSNKICSSSSNSPNSLSSYSTTSLPPNLLLLINERRAEDDCSCSSSTSSSTSNTCSSLFSCSNDESIISRDALSSLTSSSQSDYELSSSSSSFITDRSNETGSESSGVGTCGSGGSSSSFDATPTTDIQPGMMVVCVENYSPQAPIDNHLLLTEGDIIEVTGAREDGFLEGSLRGQIGLFPSSSVQEMRMKVYYDHLRKEQKDSKPPKPTIKLKKVWGEPHTVILHRGQKGFGFVLRGAKADSPLMELQPSDRFPALQYLDDVDAGGVADRAGLHKGDFILAINNVDVSMSSHESVVDLIRKSGELVSLTVIGLSSIPSTSNNEDSQAGNSNDKNSLSSSMLINNSNSSNGSIGSGGTPTKASHFATLPRKYSYSGGSVPSPPRRDPTTSLTVGRSRAKSMVATLGMLERDADHDGVRSTSIDSLEGGNTGLRKSALIKGRPSSSSKSADEAKMFESVNQMKKGHQNAGEVASSSLHKVFHSTPDLKDKEIEENQQLGTIEKNLEKKFKSQEALGEVQSQEQSANLLSSSRHSWAFPSQLNSKNNGNSHDSEKDDLPLPPPPPLPQSDQQNEEDTEETLSSDTEEDNVPPIKPIEENKKKFSLPSAECEYRSIKPLRPIQSKTLPRRASTGTTSGIDHQSMIMNLVPPGQVIRVDVSKKNKEYDISGCRREGNISSSHLQTISNSNSTSSSGTTVSNAPMSSFKPNDSAKLYASPQDLKSFGYRESLPQQTNSNVTGDEKQQTNGVTSLRRKSEGYANNADAEFLQEAKERLKPVLKNNTTINNSNSEKIRLEINQSPKLSSKRIEKTVTFQTDGDTSNVQNVQQSSSSSTNTTNTLPHSASVDEFQKVKSSLKSSKSFPNDFQRDEGASNNGTGNDFITTIPVNQESEESSEDSSDKTWVCSSTEVPVSASTETKEIKSTSKHNYSSTIIKLPSEKEQKFNETKNRVSHNVLTEHSQPTLIQTQHHLYHTLQPVKSKSLTSTNAQIQQQNEKSIEDSIKLIRMHVEALKENQNLCAVSNQTPILAPPPEFSDARDTHESATHFNQGLNQQSIDTRFQQNFNRNSPIYRSITSSSNNTNSPLYNSGYATMTRQQLQYIPTYPSTSSGVGTRQLQQDLYSNHLLSGINSGSYPPPPPSIQSIPTSGLYHTVGRTPSTQQQHALKSQNLYQHHPRCLYYQQNPSNSIHQQNHIHMHSQTQFQHGTTSNQHGNKYIPEKLHPVSRVTMPPDLYENTGVRIVGTIPKKPIINDHYEIPHAQQVLMQQQQQEQRGTGSIVRSTREFRNKNVGDWTVSDTCDWLDSLFMPEHKLIFSQRQIDGKKLIRMDNATLLELGVKKLGHRMNIEKSLKRFLPQSKT